jgi:hypothetical protein
MSEEFLVAGRLPEIEEHCHEKLNSICHFENEQNLAGQKECWSCNVDGTSDGKVTPYLVVT